MAVLCYSSNFRPSLGRRSTRHSVGTCLSLYECVDLNSPRFQLQFSQIPTEILPPSYTKPCICRWSEDRGFSHSFPGKGMHGGQNKLAHNMPHYPGLWTPPDGAVALVTDAKLDGCGSTRCHSLFRSHRIFCVRLETTQ